MCRIHSTSRWFAVLVLVVVAGGPVASADTAATLSVTLLFTNDFESAYDPIPAYWRGDLNHLGGVAQLATLIEQQRREAPGPVFLLDAGDIFTGTLAKLTRGELSFELMITMGYDAMTIGNHEFEYGWQTLREAMQRAPFPALAANVFYAGTDIPFTQAYTVLERDGFRVAVIGVIGRDAATALVPANVRGLEFREPVPIVRELVARLRPDVDLVVVLTHQGKTAPMQTDAEARSEVQRGIDADLDLAGAVAGIDVVLGGHADAGTEAPVVHPRTGALLMQTYGHGTRLGRLRLTVDMSAKRVVDHDGTLLLVDSDRLEPHPMVATKLAAYRARHPEIQEVIGRSRVRIVRGYNQESDLGNLFADILREYNGTEIGLINAGALRGDLPAGEITREDLLDAFPFTDRVVELEMGAEDLVAALEQSLTLERGMLQVSGLVLRYDLGRLAGTRVVEVRVGGAPLDPAASYRVATIDILAQGGDLYRSFTAAKRIGEPGPPFADVLEQAIAARQTVEVPPEGRLLDVRTFER